MATKTETGTVMVVNEGGSVAQVTTPADEQVTRIMTPEDSRSVAVAGFLAGCYEKASTLQLTQGENERLLAVFPDDAVRRGADGDDDVLFISHIHLSNRLNAVLGIGQWALLRRSLRTEEAKTAKGIEMVRIYFEGVLVFRGVFIAEAIGVGNYHTNNSKEDYGTALEIAMSNCLTRCCKRLGIGSQVWDKGYCNKWLADDNKRLRDEAQARMRQTGKAAPAMTATAPAASPAKAAPTKGAAIDVPSAEVPAAGTPAAATVAATVAVDHTLVPVGPNKGKKFTEMDDKFLNLVLTAVFPEGKNDWRTDGHKAEAQRIIAERAAKAKAAAKEGAK